MVVFFARQQHGVLPNSVRVYVLTELGALLFALLLRHCAVQSCFSSSGEYGRHGKIKSHPLPVPSHGQTDSKTEGL